MPGIRNAERNVLGNHDGRLISLSMLDALKKAKLQPKTVVA
ncbi:MAG: hypothetical protein ACREIJ_01000 [Nitrospiraceae bacterium]